MSLLIFLVAIAIGTAWNTLAIIVTYWGLRALGFTIIIKDKDLTP